MEGVKMNEDCVGECILDESLPGCVNDESSWSDSDFHDLYNIRREEDF